MGTVDSSRIDCTVLTPQTNKYEDLALLLLAAACLAMPQEFTAAQLAVIRQHEVIAASNAPSPLEALPGWDEHQAQLNAVYALQGISPGQNAHDAAIARVLAQESELAGFH